MYKLYRLLCFCIKRRLMGVTSAEIQSACSTANRLNVGEPLLTARLVTQMIRGAINCRSGIPTKIVGRATRATCTLMIHILVTCLDPRIQRHHRDW